MGNSNKSNLKSDALALKGGAIIRGPLGMYTDTDVRNARRAAGRRVLEQLRIERTGRTDIGTAVDAFKTLLRRHVPPRTLMVLITMHSNVYSVGFQSAIDNFTLAATDLIQSGDPTVAPVLNAVTEHVRRYRAAPWERLVPLLSVPERAVRRLARDLNREEQRLPRDVPRELPMPQTWREEFIKGFTRLNAHNVALEELL